MLQSQRQVHRLQGTNELGLAEQLQREQRDSSLVSKDESRS